MITQQDIMERLGVTQAQVEMAIYSGYIIKPTSIIFDEPRWSARKIEPFLKDWEARIRRRNKDASLN